MDSIIYCQSKVEILPHVQVEGAVYLMDENTHQCFSALGISTERQIVIPAGEESKSLAMCTAIFDKLIEFSCDRNSTLVCIGGGVVTDLAAFCASTFKRGMKYIHVPTSLLAMVDASIGGKNGVNYQSHKNYIGTITQAEKIVMHPGFLESLPADELLSGYAELVKHALIADKDLFAMLETRANLNEIPELELIKRAVEIKNKIVEEDRFEAGQRKLLNLGHTIGHALESQLNNSGSEVKHGYAVAAGICCESVIAHRKKLIDRKTLDRVFSFFFDHFPQLKFNADDYEQIIAFATGDKKNKGDHINCSLLSQIGKAEIDISVSKSEIIEGLNYYSEFKK